MNKISYLRFGGGSEGSPGLDPSSYDSFDDFARAAGEADYFSGPGDEGLEGITSTSYGPSTWGGSTEYDPSAAWDATFGEGYVSPTGMDAAGFASTVAGMSDAEISSLIDTIDATDMSAMSESERAAGSGLRDLLDGYLRGEMPGSEPAGSFFDLSTTPERTGMSESTREGIDRLTDAGYTVTGYEGPGGSNAANEYIAQKKEEDNPRRLGSENYAGGSGSGSSGTNEDNKKDDTKGGKTYPNFTNYVPRTTNIKSSGGNLGLERTNHELAYNQGLGKEPITTSDTKVKVPTKTKLNSSNVSGINKALELFASPSVVPSDVNLKEVFGAYNKQKGGKFASKFAGEKK